MPLAVGIVARKVSAPFVPTDLANLIGWWDASDASTFTFSSGAEVSQWRDKSGNARHFAQATAGNQPTRAVVTQNGLPGVTFATSDFMDVDATTDAIDVSPWTVFAVVKHNTAVDTDGRILTSRISATGTADTACAILIYRSGTTNNISAFSAGTFANTATGSTSAIIVGSRYNGTNIYSRVGAGAESTGKAASASANVRYLRMGAVCQSTSNPPGGSTTNNYEGAIFEMFLYNADVTVSGPITYLQNKWAV